MTALMLAVKDTSLKAKKVAKLLIHNLHSIDDINFTT